MASGLFEAHKKEDCELHLAQSIKAEVQKLWDRMVVHVQHAMEARRYRDPNARRPDPDAPPVTAEDLERLIKRIAREQEPGFRGPNINHTEGGGKESSWKDYILGVLALVIVAWLGRISLQMEELQVIAVRQQMMDKHLESTDSRVDRVEARVYRGTQ